MAGRTAQLACLALLLALWAVICPEIAAASDLDDFQACRAAYTSRDWAQAVSCFEELVGGETSRLTSTSLTLESRKYLGAAYVFVGRREAAADQFERLLSADPSYELDAASFPVEVVELFSHVRGEIQEDLRRAEEAAAEEARRARELERARALAALLEEEVVVEVENSRWIAAIPFGVGQFERGDDGLGAFFLVSETFFALSAAISLGIFTYVLDAVRPLLAAGASDDPLVNARIAEANRLLLGSEITNWISASAFVLLVGSGILEAELNFTPTRTVRHRRSIPPELLEGLSFSVGPGTVTLRVSF